MFPTTNRDEILAFAKYVLPREVCNDHCSTYSRNMVDNHVVLALHHWATYGCQSVIMPETYAAALMATECRAAFEVEHDLPWPCFEVQVPNELLSSSHGVVKGLWVNRLPAWIEFAPGADITHRYCIVYSDGLSFGARTFESLQTMAGPEEAVSEAMGVPDGLFDAYDSDRESRLWQLIGRLVGGVILAITEARTDKPTAFPSVKNSPFKGDRMRQTTQRLGRPLVLDCRGIVRDYIEGRRGSARAPSVSTFVRGHWRNVACGTGRWRRVPRWIKPFQRGGDGPVLMRPTHLRVE